MSQLYITIYHSYKLLHTNGFNVTATYYHISQLYTTTYKYLMSQLHITIYHSYIQLHTNSFDATAIYYYISQLYTTTYK